LSLDAAAVAPDLIEPILGWKSWRAVAAADGQVRLASVVYGAVWPVREELVADCEARHWHWAAPWRQQQPHAAPHEQCSCGIYAAAGLESALRYAADAYESRSRRVLLPVLGVVSLWGKVVECKQGWRAERAYPRRLYLLSPAKPRCDPAAVVAALAAYRVPVTLVHRTHDTVAAQLRAHGDPLRFSIR
jgi:hypothetical protein